MPLHGLGVAAWQDEGGADAALRTDGAEDVGRLGALVPRRARAGPTLRPTACDLVLLADSRFILPPQFYGSAGRERGADRFQLGREAFLKPMVASSF